MRPAHPSLWRVCAFFVVALVVSLAARTVQAQTVSTSAITTTQTAPRSVTIGTTTPLSGGPLQDLLKGRTYTLPGATTDSGERLLNDLLKGPGPGGAGTVPLKVTRAVPWGAIGRSIGKAVPYLGTALTIKELMDGLRCAPGVGSEWQCDHGQDPLEHHRYCFFMQKSGGGYADVAQWVCGPPGKFEQQMKVISEPTNSPIQTITCTFNPTGGNCSGTQLQKYSGNNPPPATVGFNISVQRDGSEMGCAPVDVGGTMVVPLPGPDGKCPTGIKVPTTQEAAGEKATQHGNRSKASDYLRELDKHGIPVDTAPPVVEGPASIQGEEKTTTKPDGSSVTEKTEHPISYGPGGYTWGERITSTPKAPDGTTQPPTVTETPPAAPPTVVGGGGAPATEFKTCGLPGTPPCKLDETGTPEPDQRNPQAELEAGTLGQWKTCLLNPASCIPALPSLHWGFTLPSTCSPFPMGPGYAALGLEAIDMCKWKDYIHDLMSMLWAAAGLFASINLLTRDSTGG